VCGRFTLKCAPKQVAELFQLDAPPDFLTPRYNVAPAQLVAVVGLKPDGKTRGLARLKWGFVPSWANDPDTGPKPINARAESVAFTPPFEHAFNEGRRCLVPADGFNEGPLRAGRRSRTTSGSETAGPFAFAGVWDCWRAEGRPLLLTCAIISTRANELVKPFHHRMPAILAPEDYAGWLEHDVHEARLLAMLAPFPADQMEAMKLTPLVNNVKNDGPECLTPAA
jgi:putative SOS response-associated peptidase YedK